MENVETSYTISEWLAGRKEELHTTHITKLYTSSSFILLLIYSNDRVRGRLVAGQVELIDVDNQVTFGYLIFKSASSIRNNQLGNFQFPIQFCTAN